MNIQKRGAVAPSPALHEALELARLPTRLLELLERRVVVVDFSLASEVHSVRKLMARYASVPMSLADACLVRMAELKKDLSIVTLDSDFHGYRRGRAALSVLAP